MFGTPQIPEATLNLPDGKTFVMKASNLSDKNIYIAKVLLNGKDYTKGYITHQILMDGGTLEFQMSDKQGMVFPME